MTVTFKNQSKMLKLHLHTHLPTHSFLKFLPLISQICLLCVCWKWIILWIIFIKTVKTCYIVFIYSSGRRFYQTKNGVVCFNFFIFNKNLFHRVWRTIQTSLFARVNTNFWAAFPILNVYAMLIWFPLYLVNILSSYRKGNRSHASYYISGKYNMIDCEMQRIRQIIKFTSNLLFRSHFLV